jgi:hypothetical protein
MAKERLHLSLHGTSIERARRYGRMHSTTISQIVDSFLARLPLDDEPDDATLTPTVRRLLGIAPGAGSVGDYHDYLAGKYGS